MILLLFFLQVAYGKAQGVVVRDQEVTLPARPHIDSRSLEIWRLKWAEERMFLREGNETIFDTTITRDLNGFRTVPDTITKKKLNYHIFFGGCSFMFGQGLNDADTAPAMVSEYLPETRVVNMAAPGTGISEQLYLWRNFSWNEVYKEKKGLLLYSILNDHFERLTRTWRYLDWVRDITPYFEEENGRLIYRGVVGETDGYKWSQWLKAKGLTEWWLRGTSHFLNLSLRNSIPEMVLHLSELKREYLSQFPEGRFVLVWRPYILPWKNKSQREDFLLALKKSQIEYWEASADFHELDITGGREIRMIKGDGHPNSFANKEFTDHLVKQIKLTTSQPTL